MGLHRCSDRRRHRRSHRHQPCWVRPTLRSGWVHIGARTGPHRRRDRPAAAPGDVRIRRHSGTECGATCYLRQDRPRCERVAFFPLIGLTPATSAPGLGRLLLRLHRDWARRPGPLPHLHRDWGSPRPHRHRDWGLPRAHRHRDWARLSGTGTTSFSRTAAGTRPSTEAPTCLHVGTPLSRCTAVHRPPVVWRA